MNGEERRISKRFSLREPVQFQFLEAGPFTGGMSQDISETGIKIRLNDFLPLGTALTLHIQVTAQKSIECTGRVVWVQKLPHMENYQAGVHFVGIDSSSNLKQTIPQYFLSNQ